MHAPTLHATGVFRHALAPWVLACALLSGTAHASPLLPVEHPAHQQLAAWAARGLLPATATRPLTWAHLERMLEAATPSTPADRTQIDRLRGEARLHRPGRRYLEMSLIGAFTEGGPFAYPPPPLPANGGGPFPATGGRAFAERWGAEVGARLEQTGNRLTAVVAPHRMLGHGEGGHPLLQEGYLAANAGPLWLAAGHQPIVWGPGPDGGFLLSTNAAPLPALRVRSDELHRFSGKASWLGRGGFDLFFARLEGNRAIPHPVLAGLRLDWAPGHRLAIGLSRTVMAGGRGHSLSGSDVWRIITGSNQRAGVDTSNSIAGFDVALILPAGGHRGVRLYTEYAGEDESNAWPTKPAIRGGLLLAGLGPEANHSLHAELAATDVFYDAPPSGVWYRHSLYSSGYTFRGRIIGDPIGPKGRRSTLAWRRFGTRNDLNLSMRIGTSTSSPATGYRQVQANWRRAVAPGAWWEVALGTGTRCTGADPHWEHLVMFRLQLAAPG
ncbi:MAG: capsule assembly Wzi family protein [Nitrospirota bacterium]|nr:capsule assembly Wzi family protein [Nitrospirota bacterium]